ncbi:uncharacterized protein LOC130293924 [Hyla sarda]|uniref:uncharacterized protein LOC130293924 n=1 Tax=Hyla sarda TaxID=327740 RepID=UPI0024C33999|nr:uncharacterized protein LOC130293924 [Hyla sarda]
MMCYCGAHSEKPTDIRTCFTMRVLLLVSVQTILMASGYCFKCITCNKSGSIESIDCHGPSRQCGLYQMCLTMYIRTFNILQRQLSRANTYYISRQCGDPTDCGNRGTMSSPSHKMAFVINCCSPDNCKISISSLRKQNNTHNGLVCPAMSTFLEVKNEPTYAMKCTGDETKCFEFTSDRSPKEYVTGCASYQYCYTQPLIGDFYRNDDHSMGTEIAQTSCKTAKPISSLPVDNSLICWQCRGSVDHTCERFVKCSTEYDVCVTIISKTTYGRRQLTELLRRCGYSSECDSAGIITTAQKSISKNTTCCYTDHCISPIPTLPSENNENNGLICESCYLINYNNCSGRDHINCTGNATQCISYTKIEIDETLTSKEVLHGCAHPSICDSGNITATFNNKIIQETKICSVPAKSSGHFPNILCATILFIMWSDLM